MTYKNKNNSEHAARRFRADAAAIIGLALACAFGSSSPVAAADPQNSDWPCVQRKVDELSAAAIWDGPSVDGLDTWRKDDAVRKLSDYLISRRIPEADAEAAIKRFAEKQPEDVRDRKLTELFAGVLTRTNEERRIVMSGIERFHKRQLARSAEIEKAGLELPNGETEASPEQAPAGEIDKLTPEHEKYDWEVRIFQQRQANIPIACEIPQLIDERAGAVARAIRAEMKS